jgi:hypothetical protein
MFRRIEPILITRQEIIVLLRIKSTMAKRVHVVIRVKYIEPRF